jgi:cyclohexanone monooxygenase
MAGFPNLFTVTGPGSPSVLSNMMVSIEQHVEWICETIVGMKGKKTIEPEVEAQESWVQNM